MNNIDKIQNLMDEVYKEWQKKENVNKKKNEILEKFSKAHDIAVRFGNLNYQVENGGFSQWISNGYLAEDIENLLEYVSEGKTMNLPNFTKLYNILTLLNKEINQNNYDIWGYCKDTCGECNGSGYIDSWDDEEICDYCGGSGTVEEFLLDRVDFDFDIDNWYYSINKNIFNSILEIIESYE